MLVRTDALEELLEGGSSIKSGLRKKVIKQLLVYCYIHLFLDLLMQTGSSRMRTTFCLQTFGVYHVVAGTAQLLVVQLLGGCGVQDEGLLCQPWGLCSIARSAT